MVDAILTITAILYTLGTGFLVIFIGGFGVLLMIYFRTRQQIPQRPDVNDEDLLSVTVQLPIYNEPLVVDRLLDACVQMDYPTDRLHIQILDDSTDNTSNLIQKRLACLSPNQFATVSYIQRKTRSGFKAGALANGLAQVKTDCVVIFDADFVPNPDFLRQTMPHFNGNSNLGLIQTRWDHLNLDYNLLTRVQALNIDAHFAVEQVARNRGRLPMAMNGTGGLWRVRAIQESGGWSSATLTEDLDLSYRAYMQGWGSLYLVDVAVPGELPPLIQAYKTQQARWATGSTQCLMRHVRNLITCRHCSPLKKLMGFLHLAQYVAQPVILMLFLLTPVLIWGNMFERLPDLTILALIGLIPPLMITIGQMELYDDWRNRLLYFPVQFVAAVAIVLNNSRAVFAALGSGHEFKRTPKWRLTQRQVNRPIIQSDSNLDAVTVGELCLALYALLGFEIALENLPALAPYMLSYATSFAVFALWNIYQSIVQQ